MALWVADYACSRKSLQEIGSSRVRQARSDTGSQIRCRCIGRSIGRVQDRVRSSVVQRQREQADMEVSRQARVSTGAVQGIVKTSRVSHRNQIQSNSMQVLWECY